jgi:hypothetical protein
MAVTKETYTAAATWTAAQLATLFEDAFVDAGLMAAWYDTFLSGTVENRILEITYDGAKTYGTTYYWFMFTTTTIGVSVASGWNATTHVPTGTQYLDFFATTTNATTNHYGLRTGLATGTTAELVRYTASGYSWFAFRNGATPTPFFIAPASTGIAPWIDLDKVLFHHFIVATASAGGFNYSPADVNFNSRYALRRSYYSQGAFRSNTSGNSFSSATHQTLGYQASSNSTSSVNQVGSGSAVLVPYGFNNTNPAYTTDYTPIVNGYSYSNYTTSNMPADFGIFFSHGTTTFAFGDRIVVSAGVEEWEIYLFANNAIADAPSALLVARVV